MDERQAQVREGEGLTESRVNQDFVDFLKKWGWHAVMAVLLVVLAMRGWDLLEQRRVGRIDEAFRQLEAAGSAAETSPTILLSIADDFEGVRAISILARLRAADAWMVAVRRGVHPGAEVLADGSLSNPDDLLNDNDRSLYLDNAAREYATVRQKCAGNPKLTSHEINALYGLAAVEESRGNMEGAKGYYEDVIRVADEAGLAPHPQIAQERIDTLGDLAESPTLYARADLPVLPWNEEVAAPDEDAPNDEGAAPDDAGQPEGADPEGDVTEDDGGPGEVDPGDAGPGEVDDGEADDGAEDDGGAEGEGGDDDGGG